MLTPYGCTGLSGVSSVNALPWKALSPYSALEHATKTCGLVRIARTASSTLIVPLEFVSIVFHGSLQDSVGRLWAAKW